MHKLSFSPKLVKLCRFLNSDIYAKVKTGKQLSPECKVNKAFRQGDAI
jgi:transposase